MWMLVKRELNDDALILLIGLAGVIVTGAIPLAFGIRDYDAGTIDRIGLPQNFEGFFNLGTVLFSLLVAALGINQMYKDRVKKISAFLVTLATTRQRVLLAKIFTGVVFTFVGFVISALPVMIMLKKHPPLLPVDYSVLLTKWVFAFGFGLTAYMLGLSCGFAKSQWGLVVLPLILLALMVGMMLVSFSPAAKFIVLVLMGFAFLIYARQQFLRASL
jgi:hypothetical protein